ncbi:helix-turn-helix domain-containing protein [Thalassotalea marina]|uniref:Uncharacterized protein n=1 Tax=Thalassotalea marina TaxID=1673741 RepID=A0A919BS62_9GAMM|nr:helix-turn-helix transcriptional regulator [Thalassotalea marina]GHG07189.1 hypothetical protein GCM10017161_41140 [Thalassotalea marina]
MSETSPIYSGQGVPETFAAFKNRPCALGVEHPNFILPTPIEIKALRKLMGFSQVDVAKLTGCKWNVKGSSAVRKWETVEGKEHRSISPSAWQLMLLKSGLVTMEPLVL